MRTNNVDKPSILLVDDKPENLFVLEKLLNPLEVNLRKATSGNEALTTALQQDFVLMLLDVNMPEMDGYEVLELMYSDEKLKQIPVIFVTAYYTDEPHRLRGYQLGAVDYLYKPIDEEILLSKVKVFLELYKKRQENINLQQRTQLILDSAGEGIFGVNAKGIINFVNPAAATMFEREGSELISCSLEAILPKKTELKSGYDWKDTEIYQASSVGYFHRAMDRSFVTKEGVEFPVDYVITSIRNEQDEYSGAVVVFTSALQRQAHDKTEKQLLQAQKMESVGQLTGGLAHDFNNILMTIQGNLELLSMRFEETSSEKRRINTALTATQRGAELTQRMLAFARKQTLFPTAIDLRENLKEAVELLKPTLGELIQIHLSFAEELWMIWADRGQLENAIVNLGINARDAMTKGGNLFIEAQNVCLDEATAMGKYQIPEGDYVKISVTDEGQGMSTEVMEHIFEPFFTTKETGKGTGLGLSMVYGFVKQSKGSITVYSEPDRGTTFALYLPRLKDDSAQKEAPRSSVQNKTDLSGTETILVVEDEESVRELAAEYLKSKGYPVLMSQNGAEALEILKSTDNIELVFTDVVMPGGLSGFELAKQAKAIRPNLKILFASGYPKQALSTHQEFVSEEHLVKPYKLETLAQKIREILDKTNEKKL